MKMNKIGICMKKISVCIGLVFLLMLGACETKKQKEAALEQQMTKNDSLELVVAQMKNETNDLNNMKAKLLNIMRQINEAEGRILSVSPESSESQIVVENMAFVQQKMEEYRKIVAEMQQQLRNANQLSEKAKRGYASDIEKFRRQIALKNQEIDSLRLLIVERNLLLAEQGETILQQEEALEKMMEQNAEQEQTLLEQDRRLHTAWYVYGTKKELEEHEILVKNKVLTSQDANKEYFTEIDIRVTKIIPLHSKRVKLLTTHPAGSYTLDKDTHEQYTLRITDPDAFWSVSHYLVVSVK